MWLGHVGVSVSERCWSRAVALTGLSSATRGHVQVAQSGSRTGHFGEHPDLRECELAQGHNPLREGQGLSVGCENAELDRAGDTHTTQQTHRTQQTHTTHTHNTQQTYTHDIQHSKHRTHTWHITHTHHTANTHTEHTYSKHIEHRHSKHTQHTDNTHT